MVNKAKQLKTIINTTVIGLGMMMASSCATHAQNTPAISAAPGLPRSAAAVTDTTDIVEPFQVRDEAEFFSLLDLQAPGMAAVKAAVTAKDWPRAKQAWADHLQARTNAQWYWSYHDRDAIKQILARKKQSLSLSLPAADKVLLRQFNFVGVPKVLDKAPQWNQGVNDWTSVLNRFPYFRDLGQAYWASGDKKYAQDFVFLLEDWIAKNPVPQDVNTFGVFGNPWRSLEDGLRIQSWLDGMQFFMNAPEFNAEAKYRMTKSLVEHARYLRAVTIRKGFRAGNWQIIESTGLSSIGIMLPEFREAAQWRARGFQTLVLHMEKDIYPDGGLHELTPGYHMFVTNQYLLVSLLSKKNGYEAHGLLDRHEKMYEFLMALSKPDRLVVPVGDSGPHSIEGSMADASMLYGRPDMHYLSGSEDPTSWVWNFGPGAFERFAKLPAQRPRFTSQLLPDSKFVMMRTGWDKQDRFLMFKCAPYGGGHSHQDRLEVVAYAGRDLLVDPGQYGYDQPLAPYFRADATHNVVLIDGQEQPHADPVVQAWQATPGADFAAGSISANGVTHQRSVLFVKPDYWVVVDHVDMQGAAAQQTHEVTRLFHFVPTGVQVIGDAVRTTFAEGMNLQVQAVDGAPVEMRKGWVSTPFPAKADEAPVAAFVTKSKLPMTLVTVLTPFGDVKGLPKVEALAGNNPLISHVRLTFVDGQQDEVAVSTDARDLQIGSVKGHGRALYMRRGPRGNESAVLGAAAP